MQTVDEPTWHTLTLGVLTKEPRARHTKHKLAVLRKLDESLDWHPVTVEPATRQPQSGKGVLVRHGPIMHLA